MIQKETTLFNGTPSFVITPDEGKMLVRKSDKEEFYGDIKLGVLNGVLETPDDFEEIDIPKQESTTTPNAEIAEAQYKVLVEKYIRDKYTVSDELAILRQRDEKTDEFQEYYDYCEECKVKAKAEVKL